jgi:3-methylcrotonyl-CoA carboxylase alpha subunit
VRLALFDKILIANRGEIACRVMATARRLGIATVAVYSDADANARHAAMADEAVAIGPAPAAESYLRGDTIIKAALDTGAQAIHPGYGFLAENAGFAQACADAGVVFIGPLPATIAAMGDKAAAKTLMEQASVPVVPGFHGDQDDGALGEAASKVGFPVLIKPVAGGGGTGMRVVETTADFADALAGARREAKAAFGDDRVLLERYVDRPRHIEVQVFGDNHGDAVHLFERDCSIQRRYQKVIEEAPAPMLDTGVRGALLDAAVAAARAVDYRGAGTVEFLVDREGGYFFLEMNTRLQVEHPVTEMITGIDLVEWQLRVAAGEPLPCGQDAIVVTGHAIEARLYAEDPARGFLPSSGQLYGFRTGAAGDGLRLETGVREGDTVSPHYDAMIAKLVVSGADREAAVACLLESLAETRIAGVANNVVFLKAIAGHAEFKAGGADTGFIDRHSDALAPLSEAAPDFALALAAADAIERRSEDAALAGLMTNDPYSPWHGADGWRLNGAAQHYFRYLDGDRERSVSVIATAQGHEFEVDDAALAVSPGNQGSVVVGQGEVTVFTSTAAYRLVDHDPLIMADSAVAGDGRLTAPMPGRVVAIMADAGATVARGAALMVIEAMKMEHTIAAPADGHVDRFAFAPGDQVDEGAELMTFIAEEDV